MSQAIRFNCRSCEAEIGFNPAAVNHVDCPQCKKSIPVRVEKSLLDTGIVRHCVACGHDSLYLQKDFNRSAGVAVVAAGSLIALYFFSQGQPLYAFLALFAMAGIDLLAYLLVGAVTVCYACHAIYRGFEKNPDHGPFDLKDLEKYGGRDPRF